MTTYRTCRGCIFGKGPCVERNKLRSAVAGLGLTSIKFKCAWRRAEFRPGQPVHISMIDYSDDYEGGTRISYVDGFFVSECSTSSKVVVFALAQSVDEAFEGDVKLKSNGYMRLSRSVISPRPGVPASVCKGCGNLTPHSEHGDWCKHHPDAEKLAKELWGAW